MSNNPVQFFTRSDAVEFAIEESKRDPNKAYVVVFDHADCIDDDGPYLLPEPILWVIDADSIQSDMFTEDALVVCVAYRGNRHDIMFGIPLSRWSKLFETFIKEGGV